MDTKSAVSGNRLIDALPAETAAALRQRLKPMMLEFGVMLGESGAPITQAVFPRTGLISVVTELSSGERIETALIGRSGVLGASAPFGAGVHISTSFAQMAGDGMTMRASELIELAQGDEALRTALYTHEEYILAQSQQSVACNARHQISERLATWLIRARDAVEQDVLTLTQEFLAQMLGVQRASVSLVAAKLQEEGLIRYRRGRIEIVDEKKLGERACECCHVVRTQYRRLFGDNGRPQQAGS